MQPLFLSTQRNFTKREDFVLCAVDVEFSVFLNGVLPGFDDTIFM